MSMHDAACMLLLASLAGCSFDFTDLPRNQRARFQLNLVADSRADQLTMSAHLLPGRDSDGTSRTVLTDMAVSNETIPPAHIAEDENRTHIYSAERSLSSVLNGAGSVVVRAPAIEGLQSFQHQISLPLTLRDGSDSLFVSGDDPAVLRLAPSTAAEEASVNWHLQLMDSARGSHRSIEGVGPFPDEFTIPRSWFDRLSLVYDVRLDVRHTRSGEFIPDHYAWSASALSQIHWTIIFSDP